ncbi:MAG: hypothetical protein ACE5G1_02635 [bacterium]
MKFVLWVSFYFISFVGMVALMYSRRDKVYEETENIPILNYTQYHQDAAVSDSSYVERIDSLATVIEGMLTEMADYVTQLRSRDEKIVQQQWQIDKITQDNKQLKTKIEELEKFNAQKAHDEQKLQELANTLSSMKADVLGPMLENLSDEVVSIIYDKAKKKDKANILKSLKPERAGKIMSKLAGE